MNKISVPNIVKYFRKVEKNRATFIANLKKPVVKKDDDEEGGGNYWVHSYSTISKAFKTEELNLLDLKIDLISEKKSKATLERSKIMYQRNIDILFGAKDLDFKELKPYFDVKYLKNTRVILNVSSIPIEISPNHVFWFNDGDHKKVGAIWFVVIKEGYKDFELALFNYCLYQYLHSIYKDKYTVSKDFCIVLDITNGNRINFSKVLLDNYPESIKKELELLRKAI